MKKFLILFTISSYLLSTNLLSAVEDGGQPGAFLSYGAGARAFGMGKTFVGVADDASTVYWNPAGLANMTRREVTALYASLYENTGYSFMGYAHPLRAKSSELRANNCGTIGAAVVNLDSKGFQLRDAYNYEMGEAGVSETAGILSYGRTLVKRGDNPFVSAGAGVKVIRQIVDSQSATGYGADIGALCKVSDKLNVGLSVQNVIAPKLKLYQVTDEYPLIATVGAGYKLFKDKLLLAADVNKSAKRGYKLHFGGEYAIASMFTARAGIDDTELAAGVGFRLSNYSIDYAFALHNAWQGHDNLGQSHRIGISIRLD